MASDFSRIRDNVQRMIDAGAPPEHIDGYLSTEGLTPDRFKQLVTEPVAGVGEAFIGGAKRLGSSLLTAGEIPFFGAEEAATRGIGRREAITERPGFSEEAINYAIDEAGGGLPGYWAGAKEFASQIPSAAAEQAANLGLSIGSARAAMAVTPPVLPVVGPLAKPIAGLVGAFAPSAIPQLGTNVERQAQEDIAAGRPVDVELGKAIPGAAAQGALDVAGLKFGLGKLLGIPASKMGTEAAEKIMQQNLLTAGTKGVGKTLASELPTEVTQQVIERWQAGLPLTTDDALAEYRAVALQTAAGIGPFGVLNAGATRGEARDVLEADRAEKAQTIQDITQRQAGFQDVYAQRSALAEQEMADILGRQAVQDELSRFDDETKQRVVDTLARVRSARNQDEVNAILQDEEETRQILGMYAEAERRATTFGEHTLAEMGIPKTKKIVDLLSPMYGKPIAEIRGAIENRLEEIKKLSKGERDDEINAQIDAYLNQKLGSAEQVTTPTEQPIDTRWQAELAKRMGTTTAMPVGYQPEGYRFTEGEQFQPDLFQPGESVSNPVFNELLRGEREGIYEPTATAPELTLNEILRGGEYDPNTYRQRDLEFEPEDGGAGVEGDLGPRGELARNRALELQRMEGAGGAAGPAATQPGEFTGTLDKRSQAWANNRARIGKILNNQKLTTPEQQAKAVNQIAKMLGTMGFSARATPLGLDEQGQPTGQTSPAVMKALELTKQHAKWPAQPTPEPKQRVTAGAKTAPKQVRVDPRVTESFSPVWAKLAEAQQLQKNNEDIALIQENTDLAGALEDALNAGDENATTATLKEIDKKLNSAQLKMPRLAVHRKSLEAMKKAVERLAGEEDGEIQQAKRRGKAKRGPRVTPPSETPATVEQITEELNTMFLPKWLERNQPVVVNDYADLNQFIESGDLTANDVASAQEGAKAFVKGGSKDYYIASQIPDNDIRGTIMHERGVHIGLPKLIGQPRINALANRVMQWGVNGKGLEAKIAQEAIDLADASGEQIGSDRHNQEVVAYFTEIAVNRYGIDPLKTQPKEYAKVAQWLKDLWTSVLNAVKKLHMNPDSLTAKDIVNLVYGAARIEGMDGTQQGEVAGDVQAAAAASLPTPQQLATAQAAGRQFYTAQQPKTIKEQVQARLGKDMDSFLDLLRVKIVGGGEALARKGVDMFGPETRLNPATGRELGYLNYHRATHDTDFATGAVARGFLEFDKEGVAHVKDAKENLVELNNLANDIKAAMKVNGMTDAEIYDGFAHMMLADRFKELQQMGVLDPSEFTPQDYQYGKQLQKQYAKEYKAWQGMYQIIRGRTMNALVQSGVFTRKDADKFLNRLEYIPFNREPKDGQPEGVFLRSLLSANVDYHIKGSDRQVNDVMSNIVDNQVWLLKRAVRNNASNLIAETMEEMHRQNPMMGGYAIKFDDKDGRNIRYRKNGQEQWFKVLDKNDAAIFAAAPAVSNMAIRMMRSFSGYLRKGVTLMPSFFYSQVIQDAMRAPAVAGTEAGMFKLMGTSVPEFLKNIKSETQLARALRDAGIVGQIDYQDTYDNWKKEMFGQKRGLLGRALETGERAAQANDLATRAAVYNDILNKTGDANEASLRALMMINFQNRGHSQMMNFLMATVPFINSRIQGEYRLLQALNGKIPGVTKAHAKQLIMWRAAKFAAYTMLYAMLVGDDDEYERANEEVRNANFLLSGVKIPVAPEFLPLKVAVEKSYRQMTDNEFETDAKTTRAMMSAVGGLLLGAGDVTPTMLKPVIENATNYSFFSGRQLVGYGLQSQDVNQQFNGNTSEIAKAISNLLYDQFGNAGSVSPIKIDNVVRGLFGTMGRDVLFFTDIMSGEKPEAKLNQTPIIAGFTYDTEGGGLKSDFYELKDKSDRARATFNKLKQTDIEAARAYMESNRSLIAINSQINRISDWMTGINKMKTRYTKENPDTAREKISELDTKVHERLKQEIPRLYERVYEEQM